MADTDSQLARRLARGDESAFAEMYDSCSEPLVNGLVTIAIRGMAIQDLNRVLRTGPISEELRHELDRELALHDDPTWIQYVMTTERAVNLSASRTQFSPGGYRGLRMVCWWT